MADPIIPTTPIPSFNLNLEPNTEKPIAPQVQEPVVVEKDDRLQKEDQLVEGQIKTETIETPTKAEPATPVIVAPVVEKPVETTTPVIVTPVVEKPVETATPVIVTPVVQKPVETPAPIIVTPIIEKPVETPAPVIVTPVVEKPVTTAPTELQKDLQIIQNIQKTQTPTTPVVPTVAPIQMPTTPQANSFNLDDISTKIPSAPQMPGINTPMGNIPTAPSIPANPYDNITNYIPQIAPGQANSTPISSIKRSSKTGTEIGVGVGIGFILLAWFVIKTMYPIQYKDAMGGIFGAEEESISTVITTSLTGGNLTGDNILSGEIGDISFGSGDSTLESGAILELTGDHSAAEDTGSSIQDSNEPTVPSISMDEFKAKLEAYSSQGKLATLKAKKNGDTQLIKDSLTAYKKAEAVLQDIANGKEITTDNMNTIITEISGYLDTTNASTNATPTTTEKPINTGSSDFNPDAFFGTSGASQN